MICVIGGFGNEVEGLKFEWAWQHPLKSTIFRSGFERDQECNDGLSDDEKEEESGHKQPRRRQRRTKKKTSNGSNKALINSFLKSYNTRNPTSCLQKQLMIMLILLTECDEYKFMHLSINFIKEEYEYVFRDLFRNGNHHHHHQEEEEEEEEDNEFQNWCCSLPNQMICRTIESFDVMPFSIYLEEQKKKKRKKKKTNHPTHHHEKNHRKRRKDYDIVDMEVLPLEEEKGENKDSNNKKDDDDDGDNDEDILQEIQNLSLVHEERNEDSSNSSSSDDGTIDLANEECVDCCNSGSICSYDHDDNETIDLVSSVIYHPSDYEVNDDEEEEEEEEEEEGNDDDDDDVTIDLTSNCNEVIMIDEDDLDERDNEFNTTESMNVSRTFIEDISMVDLTSSTVPTASRPKRHLGQSDDSSDFGCAIDLCSP